MDPLAPLLRLVRSHAPDDAALELAPPARLTRHVLELDDGHRVGVAVAGRGVPLVVAHGFGVESLLYAQPLARLAALGFRVVAVDAAGHGESAHLGVMPGFGDYVGLLDRALDHLGIRHAVLAGHSMGGRLVAEVAAGRPDRALAVVLLDAIVGLPWERVRRLLRWAPPALAAYAAAFALDAVGTVPVADDVGQALKLGRRVGRSVNLHLVQPWRGFAPAQAILRAGSSLPFLARLHEEEVPVVVVHGDRDLLVPLAAGRDAATRTGGDLVVVHGGTHSWLLRCPETLPAIVGDLLDGRLGTAVDAVLRSEGLEPDEATAAEAEACCTTRGALVTALGADHDAVALPTRRHRARFRWTLEGSDAAVPA